MTEPRARARYEDLSRLPEHVVGEIVNGELVVSPRPAGPHSHAEVFADYVGIGAQPFDAVEIDMGRWWLEPEETSPTGRPPP